MGKNPTNKLKWNTKKIFKKKAGKGKHRNKKQRDQIENNNIMQT